MTPLSLLFLGILSVEKGGKRCDFFISAPGIHHTVIKKYAMYFSMKLREHVNGWLKARKIFRLVRVTREYFIRSQKWSSTM
jgi:dissimilatory sulfite reductase (desulfoviridin) alpha/beta subunit